MTKAADSPNTYNGKHSHLPLLDEGTAIPRVIHQTFMTKNLTPELQSNVENLKKINPGWEYIIYDDADIVEFIKDNYGPKILGYYERINPRYGAARADLFRYLLLYKRGGVYLDIKSTCLRPLDEVLRPDDRYILAQWKNKPGEPYAGYGLSAEVAHIEGGEYQQWHVIAAPGHPFLKAVLESVLTNIDNYRPWLHGTGGIGVLRLTGPLAYTLAIHPLLPTSSYRAVANESVIGLDYNIYKTVSHKVVYKKNYALLTETIVHMKWQHKLPAQLYSIVKKSKHLIFGR
ncbi:hypothetical protein MTX78_05550 [Hymenobacter tibetensis]|uniref:Glycosyltransferase n=1 Tax=Hymenobacter tibetensis TaxID=497967 RepID=A0ABY4D3K2_9BACT|nr:glycosyltransferase [Hymenobacter tibetensis]UOG76065.1 hypothetical protein MTX78_05550 [Hymenobacter tibetensis]